ncbi:MAG: hypothetical protein LBT97_01550 [Planctomycetota bacterium]|nr:hypothetical protein [Planctomycetota bacterium]
MTKKSITRAFSGLALTVALLAGAAPVHAADSLLQSMDEQDLVALQAKEPAMNQGDIDAYIKLLPTILRVI